MDAGGADERRPVVPDRDAAARRQRAGAVGQLHRPGRRLGPQHRSADLAGRGPEQPDGQPAGPAGPLSPRARPLERPGPRDRLAGRDLVPGPLRHRDLDRSGHSARQRAAGLRTVRPVRPRPGALHRRRQPAHRRRRTARPEPATPGVARPEGPGRPDGFPAAPAQRDHPARWHGPGDRGRAAAARARRRTSTTSIPGSLSMSPSYGTRAPGTGRSWPPSRRTAAITRRPCCCRTAGC